MIRVAFVITGLEMGGAERQLVSLATGLDRRFFKPRVFVLRPPPIAERQQLVQRLREHEIPIEYFGIVHLWQFWPSLPRLTQRLAAFAPQVMQSFLVHANILGAYAAREARVPAISLGIRVADRRQRYRWVYRRWERAAARMATRVVSVSQQTAQFASVELHLRNEQSLVIPNGVDVDAIARTPPADLTRFGLAPDQRPILFVGRLDRQKGADRLLQLLPCFESTRIPLLVVGSGPLEPMLRRQFAKPSAANLHLAGWQPDIAGILKASNLLILPSRFEGMPNVLLEAMAAELPALVTPVEGTAEVLGDLAHGQALPFSPQLWSDRLTEVWSNQLPARELGRHNRARVREHFSLPGMIEQYARLFADLAQRPTTST